MLIVADFWAWKKSAGPRTCVLRHGECEGLVQTSELGVDGDARVDWSFTMASC